jgi:hypothetical protein
MAGNLLSQITGRGNYQINTNSIIDGDDLKPAQLSFSSSGAAGVRLRKREYIASVVAPTTPADFTTTVYRLQSTDHTTFPWLAEIAAHFTEWQLQGCVFSFETSSSNYAAGMALGTIAIGTQYNANERQFRNMEEILQSPYHTRGNPSESLMHGIECDPALQVSEKLFTRRPGCEGPPNLYDHGVVTIATEGLPAAAGTVLGRIFVTYDIEMSLPVLPSDTVLSGQTCIFGEPAMSTTDPVFGAAESMTKYAGALTLGAGVDSQVMCLDPSNGPHPQPNVDSDTDLVCWISDSQSIAGGQYWSFADAGTYKLIVVFRANVSQPTAALFTIQALSRQCEVTSDWNMNAPAGTYFGAAVNITIKTSAPGQTVQFVRQNPLNIQADCYLTICSI